MLKKLFKKDIHDFRAKDLMTKNVITLQPHDKLLKAHTMMSRYRVKKIVVTKREELKISCWYNHNKRYDKISNV